MNKNIKDQKIWKKKGIETYPNKLNSDKSGDERCNGKNYEEQKQSQKTEKNYI